MFTFSFLSFYEHILMHDIILMIMSGNTWLRPLPVTLMTNASLTSPFPLGRYVLLECPRIVVICCVCDNCVGSVVIVVFISAQRPLCRCRSYNTSLFTMHTTWLTSRSARHGLGLEYVMAGLVTLGTTECATQVVCYLLLAIYYLCPLRTCPRREAFVLTLICILKLNHI